MKKNLAIFTQTFKDLYRERILYNVFFLAIFLIFVGYLASLLVFGHQDRVMLHFGASTISLSLIAVSIAVGTRLVRFESEQRMIYLPLARPVSRSQYLVSKTFGAFGFLAINLFFLTLILVASIAAVNGPFKPVLGQWMVLTYVESIFVLSLSLFLSFLMRPGLNMMTTLSFLFLCHSQSQMQLLSKESENGKALFKFLSHLAPDGSVFFLDTRVYYEQPLEMAALLSRGAYGLVWAAAFWFLAMAIFNRRNL